MSYEVPESDLTKQQLAKLSSFRAELADALDASLAAGGADPDALYVTDYATVGDGAANDTAAVQAAIDAAIASDKTLHFPPGTYRITTALEITGARGLRITASAFASVVFPSDDITVPSGAYSALANPDQAARSAFLIRNSQAVTIDGLTFQGGTHPQIYDRNLGCAVYAHRCRGLTMTNVVVYDGCSPLQHEQNADTIGTGDSITYNATGNVMTLVDAGASFTAGVVGCEIYLSGTTDARNSSRFYVTEYVSSTSIRFVNAVGSTETSSFTYVLVNGDHGAHLTGGRFYNCRSSLVPCKGSTIIGCNFYRPMTMDFTGRITLFSKSSTNITILCPRGSFDSRAIGKYVQISGSTSNDGGPYLITAVTPKTGTTPGTLTYTRASGGATEVGVAAARFFVPNGERTGIGTGIAGCLTQAGNTMTLTCPAGTFSSGDVNKGIRISGPLNVGNVLAVPILTASSTQITFTNASGATEAYAGIWSIDGYDNVRDAGLIYGSTHTIYMTAGRGDVSIIGCKFYGVRGSAVKLSGSTAPIEGVLVQDCVMQECASALLFGADDSQEHTGLKFEGNYVRDCANGRPGWNEQCAFYGFGARTVSIKGNTVHYTHDDISTVDGRSSIGTNYGIYIGRYRAGLSQPVENVDISDNQITADPLNCDATKAALAAIHVDSCGLLARYRTGGALTFDAGGTFSGAFASSIGTNMVELNDTSAYLSQEVADGWTISIVNNSDAGNNITDIPIQRVVGTAKLYFTNASGVTNATAGTYRLKPPVGKRGSTCKITGNEISFAGVSGIQTASNVGAEITGNVFHGVSVVWEDNGSVTPRFAYNRVVGQVNMNAGIRLNNGTSWPIVHDNPITAHGGHVNGTLAIFGDIGIGVDSGTRVDFPLLGKTVKVKPTDGKAEFVLAFGPIADFVEGDTISVNGETFIYTAAADASAYPKFNTYNDSTGTNRGLVGRLDAIAGVDAADYGSFFASAVTTRHIRVRLAAANTSNAGLYSSFVRTMNPTALAMLCNASAGSPAEAYTQSQGEQSGAGAETRTVVWSPLVTYSGFAQLVAANADANTLLVAGGQYVEKVAANAGACEVIRHGDAAGTEEFRAVVQ